MTVERKYERDIDILLAEEFTVEPSFASWFLSKTSFASSEARVVDVHVSKNDNLGESDLIVVFERDDSSRFAILIEDKVDAPVQPDQAERYRMRANREVKKGTFLAYEIKLCAPQAYLTARPDMAMFERAISYEEIATFMARDHTPRGQYRSTFIATAATKRANTWARERDGDTDAFWTEAYRIAEREFPMLEMKLLNVTKGSTWINFRPRDMPTQPKRIYISLK